MSFSTLYIGSSGLTAAQRAVETAAHNIANSTVEGYTRQRLSLSAATPAAGTAGTRASGMLGTGVTVVSLDRLRDDLADRAVRSSAGAVGDAGARAQLLDRAQGVLGPYGAGLNASLDDLWASFDALAISPSGTAPRQLTLDAAHRVAEGIQDAAMQLDTIRSDAEAQLGQGIDEVNVTSREVAALNQQISDALVGGQTPGDLMDRRDLALDKLASLTGATVRSRPDGMVDVSVGGQVLVRGVSSSEVTLTMVPASYGSGADPTLAIGGRPVAAGGELGGRSSALRGDLRDLERRLDEFSQDLRSRVNTAHAAGFDRTGTSGGDVFVGGTARELQLSASLTPDRLAAAGTASSEPYDGENALALARLRQPDSTGASLGDRLSGLAATLGSRASGATRSAYAAEAGLDGVRERRNAANGVSIDEEMIDLVKFQHSYDAAARIISIADGMLDTLINRMGAGR